jgi:hypothetical protein
MSKILENLIITNGGYVGRPLIARPSFSLAVRDYFARVSSAGGIVTHPTPIAAYIDALVELGGAYWDMMESHCLFTGVTFLGCFVPLRNGMNIPTNFNFISSDHDPITGLKGDGATKYIDTEVPFNTITQNDASLSVYISEFNSVGGATYIGGSGNGSSVIARSGGTPTSISIRVQRGTGNFIPGGVHRHNQRVYFCR